LGTAWQALGVGREAAPLGRLLLSPQEMDFGV
jgi:hypothetical protein